MLKLLVPVVPIVGGLLLALRSLESRRAAEIAGWSTGNPLVAAGRDVEVRGLTTLAEPAEFVAQGAPLQRAGAILALALGLALLVARPWAELRRQESADGHPQGPSRSLRLRSLLRVAWCGPGVWGILSYAESAWEPDAASAMAAASAAGITYGLSVVLLVAWRD